MCIHTQYCILAKILGLQLGEVAPLPQLSLEAIKETLFRTAVAKSRELSIEAKKNEDARIKIFSDGSSSEVGVGASAVMYETGQPGHTDRKVQLGEVTDHTTYEAELVGALMAVHLTARVPSPQQHGFHICGQSVNTCGHHLAT